jgi:ATP-dependent protease Clp ATPase subunit
VLLDVMFEVPSVPEIAEVVVTPEVFLEGKKPR